MPENPAPCDAPPQSEFESQFRRVFEAAECRTQVELAAFLDIRQSSISDAKRRKSVPSEWLVKLFEKRRINPDWVRCGVDSKYLSLADAEQNLPHIVRVMEVRPPQECSAQELFNELVRRALQEPDIKTIQKAVADSWLPVKEIINKT
ncbi:helix-turn-helix domain-containing protein [uncultured Desulfovibrio sp.]|uniref:helix-turn-helix domain-containing protein n=1 Tax=uncultured Desulfovibrio sp. TaxID=167968 RepID=UPI00267227AE|nr:helix-turn-helix domain-containing protein [uncultured Desulfovibrio sp.]